MNLTTRLKFLATAAAVLVASAMWVTPAAAQLVNPSFESPVIPAGGPPEYAGGGDGWGAGFGDTVFTIDSVVVGGPGPFEGNQALKVFGPGPAGVSQQFPASEGQPWEASAWALNSSADLMANDQVAAVNIEWIADDGVTNVGTVFGDAIDATSTVDVWTQLSASGEAVADTAFARIVLITGAFGPGGIPGGAPRFDAASFVLVPEPGSLGLIGMGLFGLLGIRRRR